MSELEDLQLAIRKFAEEREWDQFHNIRNLFLALVGEVGEIAEILQWTPDGDIDALLANQVKKEALGEELADVLIYLLRMVDKAGIDIDAVTRAKLKSNAKKYPIDLAKGRSDKYDQLWVKHGWLP